MKKKVALSGRGRRLLAARLNGLLEARGMSRRDLADASGVGMGTVNGMSAGTREPNLSALLAITRALELRSIEELLAPLGTQLLVAEVEEVSPGAPASKAS